MEEAQAKKIVDNILADIENSVSGKKVWEEMDKEIRDDIIDRWIRVLIKDG